MLVTLALSVTFLCAVSDGANILAIVPTPSFSHQVAFTELWKELSLRGHKVTVVTTDPRNDPTLVNLTEIDVKDSYALWNGRYKFSESFQDGFDLWTMDEMFLNMMCDLNDLQLGKSELQELITGRGKFSFDVVFVEVFFPELLAFGKIYDCPTITVATIDSNMHMYQILGNPAHPVLNSDINLPYVEKLTLKERITTSLFSWYLMYSQYFHYTPRKQQIVDKYFGNFTNVTMEELYSDIDLMLVNVNPVLKGSRALGPTTVNVGGGNHIKPSKPLPKDLNQFLDSAKDGFIYFSLGGNVKSQYLKKQMVETIMETLRNLPYKVLWKFESKELVGKNEDFMVLKWAPQQDVLRHPNIKLFISQGGIQSIEEAIYTHVPMIILPFYGDQEKNGKIAEIRGFGKLIKHRPELNGNEFKEAILEVINNPKYKNAAKTMARLMMDQPMTGLNASIWWTEYVIRNKGTKHLRNPAADLPLYQFYLLDVVLVLMAVAILFITVALFILKKLFRLGKYLSGNTCTVKAENKKNN